MIFGANQYKLKATAYNSVLMQHTYCGRAWYVAGLASAISLKELHECPLSPKKPSAKESGAEMSNPYTIKSAYQPSEFSLKIKPGPSRHIELVHEPCGAAWGGLRNAYTITYYLEHHRCPSRLEMPSTPTESKSADPETSPSAAPSPTTTIEVPHSARISVQASGSVTVVIEPGASSSSSCIETS